jgi:hypothetical protein
MGERTDIIVDSVKIRRVNNDARFGLGFLCAPSLASDQPSTPDIDAAISEIRMPDYPDQRFHAVEVSQGTAIYIFPVSSPSHAVEVAGTIAEAVASVGFTGTITACSDKLGPRPRTGRYAHSAAICAVDAAVDNSMTPLHFRSVKNNWDSWAVESSTFKDIVDLLAGWAKTHTTGVILAGLHFTMSRCEPHQVAEVISRCCEDLGWAELLFPTANGDWYVRFSGEGWILAGTEIKDGKADALEPMTRLLQDMAPLYDYAAVARVHFGLVTPGSVMSQWGLPMPDDPELSSHHAAMRSSVPGIFAVQVLGPEHSALRPDGFWQVTPFASGRRMFTATNPDDWWTSTKHFPSVGFDSLREANKALLGKWADGQEQLS